MASQDKFIFRKHASIGAAAAEEDAKFLSECFVDTGDLDILHDCTDRRCIILGRTGAGKSALLNQLIATTDAIVVNPEALSFNYLTNSTILQFFLEAGVKLDLFFKLLWRHVFTVELLKNRYSLRTSVDTRTFLDRIKSSFVRDPHKERAIKYLLQWGDHFWEETEYRIKEITRRIEDSLQASVSSKFPISSLSTGIASKLSDEERAEVVQRGKSVINSIQMRELTDVLTYLKEDVFSDAEHNYFICIDHLDENWIDDNFRYLLIRSLIETIRDFLQVQNIKIVAAIRTDLIERVFRHTRDAGFQEEKYRSLYLQLHWTNQQLKAVLDRRINFLVRQTYTKKPVGYADVLPKRIGKKEDPAMYLISRTLMRPRDLIEFFNSIIEHATGKATLTCSMVFEGEGVYSKNRLRSLQDEWITDYPFLVDSISILKQCPNTFRLNMIKQEQVEEICLANSISDPSRNRLDSISSGSWAVVDGAMLWTKFLQSLIHVFYITGIVGLKTESFQSYQFTQDWPSTIVADTIGMETSVMIHPMFFRVLGVKPDN